MKLIIAIVQNKDAEELSQRFVKNGIRATKLSTTGGFLRAGNTTFLIGTADEDVPEVLGTIRLSSHQREEYVQSQLGSSMSSAQTQPVKVSVGGATVFVLDVEQFKRF
ncbi:MAG: cyclic-di-AMP receptor [Lactobacillus sp.]|jgi:uncharacterized protein YaaQ|nr:cyclic-di-AMP receptor [Lactobacillus sp.]MCH3905950.1 cyclic-di-AMP receptor [Lactobacillus sp.]MCH3990476.1 cyclic-di-AMP receptor [Lactobacillus sp.]MCH4068809.1 cyclic-di-AMP receptor [Lactobacillus sp.]MCI1304434.1 cyclic-di-AMP receptor [Lactobacillus sp.]